MDDEPSGKEAAVTVECAGCGREVPKEAARVAERDGQPVYYCSLACEVEARTAGRLAEEEGELPEE